MGTAIFKPSETLTQIMYHASAKKEPVFLAKDQGLYFMCQSLRAPDGKSALCAYAEGCNPNTDDFDTWWENCRAIAGGDDFGEEFEAMPLAKMVSAGKGLKLNISETHISTSVG
jgi:hypothetical protein